MSKFALLFLLIYVAGLLSTIVSGPIWGFYLYELVYFLNPTNRWWGNGIPDFSYSYYVVLIMLAVFVVRFKQQQNRISEMPEVKWIIGVFLFYVVATFVAVNPEVNNRFMGYLVNIWLVMYVAYRMLDSEKKVELALLFCMAGAAYIGYEAMVVGRDAAGRVEGIGMVDSPDANGVAASIVPGIPLAIYFIWLGESLRSRIFAAIAGLLIANGLILINSRGAFLGAAAGFAYFVIAMMFSKYKLPKQRAFIVIIIIASIVVAFRLIDETFIARMMTLQDQTTIHDQGSGSRRIHFWLATFDMLKDHPFGTGIYGFETLSSIYLDDPTYLTTEYGNRVRSVHSTWFQSLSEIGWMGFAAFLMVLFSLYKHLKKAKTILVESNKFRQYYLLIALEAGTLGFLVSSSFINMFRSQMLYWMLLFCISASVVMIRNYGESSTDKKNQDASKASDKSIDTPSS